MTSADDSRNVHVDPPWVGQVIHFWFEELTEADWFARSEVIDRRIRERFLSLHQRLMAHGGRDVITARPILASVIVLDQFSRNLFRDSPSAFSADPIARQLARVAIEQSFDIALTTRERLFLYLPFEHSEERADQELAVQLMASVGNAEWTRYAIAHKDIIDRFGRFPHRNAVLNRLSTADEVAFLKEPKNSF